MSKRQPMQPLVAADLDADRFTVVPQPDPVKAATSFTKTPDDLTWARPKRQRLAVSPAAPPSRVGKVQIVAWTTEDVRAELKALAALQKRSVDEILNAAISEIIKRGR